MSRHLLLILSCFFCSELEFTGDRAIICGVMIVCLPDNFSEGMGVPAEIFRRVHAQRCFSGVCAAAVSVILFLTAGCLHLEQTIEIRPGGSALISYRYSIAKDSYDTVESGRGVIDRWQGSAPADGGKPNWFFNEAKVEGYFSGSGLELRRYRRYTRNMREYVELTVFAEDAARAFASGKLGSFLVDRSDEGLLRIRAELAGSPDLHRDLTERQIKQLRALCDDLWLKLTITTPWKIVRSTASECSEKSAVWKFGLKQGESLLRSPAKIEMVLDKAVD